MNAQRCSRLFKTKCFVTFSAVFLLNLCIGIGPALGENLQDCESKQQSELPSINQECGGEDTKLPVNGGSASNDLSNSGGLSSEGGASKNPSESSGDADAPVKDDSCGERECEIKNEQGEKAGLDGQLSLDHDKDDPIKKSEVVQEQKTTTMEKKETDDALFVQHPSKKEPLPDGIYAIEVNGKSALRADVAAGDIANGTEVVLWDADYSGKQAFRFTRLDNDCYIIQMIHSGKVLASTSFSTKNGVKVVEWDNNGTDNMQWILSQDVEGYVVIRCKANGLILDYASDIARRGSSFVLWESTDAAKQKFRLVPTKMPEASERVLEDGIYEISTATNPYYALSVSGVEVLNGSQAVMWENNKSCNQKFYIFYEKGYYSISVVSGPTLSAVGFGAAPGTRVVQWVDNATANQRWALIPSGKGEYAIVSATSGMYLDFASNGVANGSVVVMWEKTGSRKQLFKFTEASAASNGYFAIVSNGKRNLSVSIDGGSCESGVQPILWSYQGTLDQKFQVIVGEDGSCMFKSLQSGLFLTVVPDSGKVIQLGKRDDCLQNWILKPLDKGVFSLIVSSSSGEKQCMQIFNSLDSSAKVGVGLIDKSSYQDFCVVPVALVESGWYNVNSATSSKLRISLANGTSTLGLGIVLKFDNGLPWQKFYIESNGFERCQIRSLYSNQYLAASGITQKNGASVVQWTNNGTANMLWTAVPTFDGYVSFSVQSSGLYLDCAAEEACSGASAVVWESTGSSKQKFSLSVTNWECVLRDWQNALSEASGGFSTFNTKYILSEGAYGNLLNAIRGFSSEGASVGFLMMDLVTGQGLSYGIDDVFYGASTVKGPYITSACKYSGLSPYSGLAYDTIVWSDNDAYASVRASYGNGCFAALCEDALTSYDCYNVWPYTTARQLASLWVCMYDYFTSDVEESKAVSDLYTHSYMSAINRCMSKGSTVVYSKPGWLSDSSYRGPVYNDAGIVVVGDRPYVLSMVTTGDFGRPSQMDALVRALDRVHSEMVGWS